jgi:ABC-type siderophore export system fused ATPase/permease subunit
LKFESYLDILEDKDTIEFRSEKTKSTGRGAEMEKKISEKSIIYIPERNWKTSIITFLNVPNLLMKGNCLLITIIEIDIKSLNMLILCHINLHISMLIHFFRKCIVFLPGSS